MTFSSELSKEALEPDSLLNLVLVEPMLPLARADPPIKDQVPFLLLAVVHNTNHASK